MNIGELTLQVSADTTPLKQSLSEANKSVEQLNRRLVGGFEEIQHMVENLSRKRTASTKGKNDFAKLLNRLAENLEGQIFGDTITMLEAQFNSALSGVGRRSGSGASGGAQPINVSMTVMTPDVGSFKSSQGQMIADLASALTRARRFL